MEKENCTPAVCERGDIIPEPKGGDVAGSLEKAPSTRVSFAWQQHKTAILEQKRQQFLCSHLFPSSCTKVSSISEQQLLPVVWISCDHWCALSWKNLFLIRDFILINNVVTFKLCIWETYYKPTFLRSWDRGPKEKKQERQRLPAGISALAMGLPLLKCHRQ